MSEKKRKANLSKLIAYLERLQADIEPGKQIKAYEDLFKEWRK